ncbi:MAG: hypothetical protein WCI27_08205, partial [Candidatus Omnitrophota bacterium]
VTFDNTSRILPVPHDEVAVTRRLFRSGESEYLINKEAVRLKDVLETFMGTGVGAESYSLVQQGRVDLVVSARPDDRRMIFDEAAGITKYKAKKREAMGKLKETDDNLLRLNDIVTEVKRQIMTVERQAQKAQRYKDEFEKLKGLEQTYALHQCGVLTRERSAVQARVDALKGGEEAAQRELGEFRGMLAQETVALEDLECSVREARDRDMKLENQIELAIRQIAFNDERLENLAQNEKRVASQKALLADKSSLQQAKIAELGQMLGSSVEALAVAAEELEARRRALAAIAAQIREYEQSMRADEENARQIASRIAGVKGGLVEVIKEREGYLTRRRRLDHEQSKVLSERAEVERKLDGLSEGIRHIMVRRQDIQGQLDRQKEALLVAREELASLDNKIETQRHKKLFLVSQKEFIEKLHVQYQDMPDPVITGRFFSPIPPDERHTGFIGKLQSVSEVPAEQREDLRRYLDGMDAAPLYEIICETKFVELDPLAIAAEIARIDTALEGLTAERSARMLAITENSRASEKLLQEAHAEDRRLSVCEAQQSDIGAEALKLLQELQAVADEIHEVDTGLLRLGERDAALAAEMGGLEAERQDIEEASRGRQEALAAQRVAREETAVAVAQVESELGAMRERERSWQSSMAGFVADMNSFREEISRLDQETLSFGERRQGLEEDTLRQNESLTTLRGEKEAFRDSRARVESEEKDLSQRLNSLRAQIAGIEKLLADGRDNAHEMALRIQQFDFQEKSVRERMAQKYNFELPVMPAEQLGEDGGGVVPVIDIEALCQDIQALIKRCDAFGGVNLLAIEEFEELKGRFQFLTKQQSDLLEAKTSLEQTIRKINKTTRELFIETFTKVNEQFREYFKLLFNGGESQLVLIDPENALESGIEIVARPPGKKLQTISLLSGGEKTMTAIALIFAVFRVNPSPFCVLDEIDAALDEANVDRFSSVLKEFAKISQFIVITHNKKTMAHANVMYGVTMQQRGVSKVVSVKFSGNQQDVPVPVQVAAEKEPAPEEFAGV